MGERCASICASCSRPPQGSIGAQVVIGGGPFLAKLSLPKCWLCLWDKARGYARKAAKPGLWKSCLASCEFGWLPGSCAIQCEFHQYHGIIITNLKGWPGKIRPDADAAMNCPG